MNSYAAFYTRLHRWYQEHGRKDLPWRTTRDAYAVYLSEVMLQQTQVKTVLERYYFQFLEKFPTLQSLAAAEEQEVLSAWQGLGYYSRARNLHKAAKACGGHLPDDVNELLKLPGIGRNTAHAVAAFAYRQPAPVMEANVKRVLSRIYALKEPASAELWDKAQALLDTENPFDYNQAMMDIGAMICTARKPECAECPAEAICRGKTSPEAFPTAKIKKAAPTRTKIIVVKHNAKGQYFAAPRKTRFLNGLYSFHEFDAMPDCSGLAKLGHIRQQYSHFTLEADVYRQHVKRTSGNGWYPLEKLKELPFSMAEHKILAMLT